MPAHVTEPVADSHIRASQQWSTNTEAGLNNLDISLSARLF